MEWPTLSQVELAVKSKDYSRLYGWYGTLRWPHDVRDEKERHAKVSVWNHILTYVTDLIKQGVSFV